MHRLTYIQIKITPTIDKPIMGVIFNIYDATYFCCFNNLDFKSLRS